MSIQNISRGKGQSAIASAAYRSGETLYSERYNTTSKYKREVQPETFILKPENAPEWTINRQRLWNEVEKIEKSKNARLAKEFNVALPIELSIYEQNNLIKEYVQDQFVNEGMVADVSIHRDDSSNPHAHVMLTNRPFNNDGNWGSKSKKEYILDKNGMKQKTKSGNVRSRKIENTDWNSTEKLNTWRKEWANYTNRFLEKNNFSSRISEKSYVEQGIEKKPTIHEGYVARKMEKNGKKSDRCSINVQIKTDNYNKEKERKNNVEKETAKTISNSLTPNEKKNLKSIAKNLKVYVDYTNLIDKERMVRNWENSLKYNEIIKDETIDEQTITNLKNTKKSIDLGKNIIEKQSDRIFNKYYPKLAEKTNYASYYKMVIAQETLKQDKALNKEEIATVLDEARNNRLDYMMKSIVKTPYIKSVRNYQKPLAENQKRLKKFYKENNVTEENVSNLDEEKQKEYKEILKKRDLNKDTLSVLNKYYTETIHEKYPYADLSETSMAEKEAMSKAIDYYGNRYSFDKFSSIIQSVQVNKYNRYEQEIGMSMIDKIENNQFTYEDIEKINNDYRLQEIYDTVSDEGMRNIFKEEVKSNRKHSYTNSFSSLVGNIRVFNSISQAQIENLRREQEDKQVKYETKKKRTKQRQKNHKKKNKTL